MKVMKLWNAWKDQFLEWWSVPLAIVAVLFVLFFVAGMVDLAMQIAGD